MRNNNHLRIFNRSAAHAEFSRSTCASNGLKKTITFFRRILCAAPIQTSHWTCSLSVLTPWPLTRSPQHLLPWPPSGLRGGISEAAWGTTFLLLDKDSRQLHPQFFLEPLAVPYYYYYTAATRSKLRLPRDRKQNNDENPLTIHHSPTKTSITNAQNPASLVIKANVAFTPWACFHVTSSWKYLLMLAFMRRLQANPSAVSPGPAQVLLFMPPFFALCYLLYLKI